MIQNATNNAIDVRKKSLVSIFFPRSYQEDGAYLAFSGFHVLMVLAIDCFTPSEARACNVNEFCRFVSVVYPLPSCFARAA
jgi:hypothetical protein